MIDRQDRARLSRRRCCSAARCWRRAARAVDTITAGAVGSGSTTIWPIYIGIQNGFFDAVGIKVDPVFAPSSTAIAQQVAAGSHQSDGRQRHRRSDPRHRQGRADRDLARRHAGAALCAARQARDQEHQGPQGQDHQHRRREGHHPHLRRTHAGAERRQAERGRLRVRGRDLGAAVGAAIGRGRCRDPDLAAQFLRRGGGLHQSRLDRSNTPRNCRSPAAPSTAPGPRPTSRCSTASSLPTTRA